MKNKRITSDRIPDYNDGRVIERPDGFYWQDPRGTQEYGPFATLLDAIADMDVEDAPEDADEPLEVAETIEEAESEVGISGWIDPETGELAEEQRPRLEDH